MDSEKSAKFSFNKSVSKKDELAKLFISQQESLTIRMYDVDSIPERTDGVVTLKSHKELNVHLLRRRTLVLGRAPFEDNLARRPVELDVPVAMQLDDCDDDPLMSICSGQEFGLLTTGSGKVTMIMWLVLL